MYSSIPAPARAQTSTGEAGIVACYRGPFHRIVFRGAGLAAYNEGRFVDDPQRDLGDAIQLQNRKILELALFGEEGGRWTGPKKPRLLEIGCGNGQLLQLATELGAEAVGITLVPEEVEECRSRGLNAHRLNYRDIGEEWTHQFDAVVCKGSIEHFVQPIDVIEGRDALLYSEFFAIMARVLDPRSPSARLTNSTIEYRRRPDPRDLVRSPFSHPRDSDAYHWALLYQMYRGWHPSPGELAERAEPHFGLELQEDITDDYHLSAERCLAIITQALKTPRLWREATLSLARHPRSTVVHAWGLYVSQSTNWYFRGASPPTQGVLQTWRLASRHA